MDKSFLTGLLSEALAPLRAEGGMVEHREDGSSPEFIVRMPCYTAFFSLVESFEELATIYSTAEREINELRAEKSKELARDLELVLLVAGECPPDPAMARKIMDDRYVCRKFVLWLDGRQLDEVLADLPFWPPPDLLIGSQPSVTAGVQEVLRGHDSQLIADLASRSPGAERIFEKIREGLYSLAPEPSTNETVTSLRALPSKSTKLEALDITDFRGIRRLQPEEMPLSGAVVFIYGPNGVGKTSIVDALEWAISGQLDRLMQDPSQSMGGGPDPILNVFSEKGEASVTCRMQNREPISRIKRGRSIERRIGSRRVADDRAVIDYAVGTKAPSTEARLRVERLRDLFRGSHMLSQHNIRQFLQLTGPAERFDILTNMVGAEEFVRFREKVASVLRHLRACNGVADENRKSLEREYYDVSARLHERQKELKRLASIVTAGKTPDDVAGGLLKGLRDCQCSVDESAIARASAGAHEGWYEFLAAHAESSIRNKKATNEDLLVRLSSLEQEQQGFVESRRRSESLRADISSLKNNSERQRSNLHRQEEARQEAHTRLNELRTQQPETAIRLARLNWLKENIPVYRRNRDTLQLTKKALADLGETLNRSQPTIEGQYESLAIKRAHLQNIEQTIAANIDRIQALNGLIKQLPDIQASWQKKEQLADIEMQGASQIGNLKQEAETALNALYIAKARLPETERAYEAEATRHDALSSILVKLEELVHSAECPLCGRVFTTTDEAKALIREHLTAIPEQLRTLAGSLIEAKRDIDSKQAQADTIGLKLHVLEADFEKTRLKKSLLIKAVQAFLVECAALGVTILTEDPASWAKALERALRDCDTAALKTEAVGLRDEISKLAAHIVEQQNAFDALRRKLADLEVQQTEAATYLDTLEEGMAERDFMPSSLPNGEVLTADISRAQDEANGRAKAFTNAEINSRDLDSAISALREDLKRADEEVASKELQLRQFEKICNGFVAKCRAFDISPEESSEGISLARNNILRLNISLAELDQQYQILQQLSSFSRLKREISDLERVEVEAKRKAEESLHDGKQLSAWASQIESLETKVVKGQVDIMGTHLGRLEPTIQQLYRRLNAHPIFGKVRIRVDEKSHELNVDAEPSVACPQLGDFAVSPSAFFSDAQMNLLAITVFLAGALRQRWSGFNTIIIDDPVQQMDDMNVCAFLDLIRGLSNQRQFIILSCSREFYLLALEKLDCLNKNRPGSFLAYRLEGVAPAQLKVHRDTP